jgi:doxX family protein
LALLMVAAFYLVHMNAGFFIAGGGYEYVLLLIVSLVLIVVFGSGRASIDEVLSRQG